MPLKFQKAFETGAPYLRAPDDADLNLLPKENCGVNEIDAALNRLAQAVPSIKKNLIEACVHTVGADGVIVESRSRTAPRHFRHAGLPDAAVFSDGINLCFAHSRLQLRFESFQNFRVRRVDFRVGQSFFRRAIGERVGQALLSFGNIFAAEHVEQFHALQIRRLGLLHGLQNRFVRRRFRHEHRHVAADGGNCGSGLNDFAGFRRASNLIQIQFRQKNRVAQIVFLRERRRQAGPIRRAAIFRRVESRRIPETTPCFPRVAQTSRRATPNCSRNSSSTPFKSNASNLASRSSPLQKVSARWPVSAMATRRSSLRCAVLRTEHAADFKQRHVIIFPADIVPQRMNQTGQQTRPQHIHVAELNGFASATISSAF